MKPFALIAIFAPLAALASLSQKDTTLMQHMQYLQTMRPHIHLSEKDTREFEKIMTNWEKYQAGQLNTFNVKEADTFLHGVPRLNTRRSSLDMRSMPGRGGKYYGNTYVGARHDAARRVEARDNPYMDGERYPLRRGL